MIKVRIQSCDIGSGRPEQGGGQLRGGLVLMNRFTAGITDPAVPYDLTMTVCAHDGVLACESFTVTRRERGPVVTTTGTRTPVIDSYLLRARQELERAYDGVLLFHPGPVTATTVSFDPPSPAQVDAFEHAQRNRPGTLTTAQVAAAYRTALRSGDPGISRRPTAAAAGRLGYSRGHISRMLSQARREGLPGLGGTRPSRRKSVVPGA